MHSVWSLDHWDFGFVWNLGFSARKFHSRVGASGFGLVEIMIAVAIITIAFFGFAQTGVLALTLLRGEKTNLEAALLAEEGLEAVRSVRDSGWENITALANGVRYYPVVENGKWKLAPSSPGLIGGRFDRYVMFGAVRRYSSGANQDRIAPQGVSETYEDSGTRSVESRAEGGGKTMQLDTYLTNFQESLAYPKESKVLFYEGGTMDTNLGNFPSANAGTGDVGQSFTTSSQAIEVTKVEFLLRRTTPAPSRIFAQIRKTNSVGPVIGTSNPLNSSTIASDALSWVEFRFDGLAALDPNTVYVVRLGSIPSSADSGSGSQGLIHLGVGQSSGSPYSGGSAILGIGAFSNQNDPGVNQADHDFSFRIYDLQ